MTTAAQKIVNRPAPAAMPVVPVHVRSTPGMSQASSLKISTPADPAEREADHTAKRIMRAPLAQPGNMISARCSPHAARFASTIVQREPPRIARKQEGTAAAAPGVSSEISASGAAGSPLPVGLRNFMEARFNADFSRVRIHTGEQAARLSSQVSARAFTVGSHIYFGRSQFQPESSDGRELIAHELTHTIQQGAATQHGGSAGATPAHQPVSTNTGISVQRNILTDIANGVVDFGESVGWRLLNHYAPELAPIIRQGPLEWLKEKIGNAVHAAFNNLMAPVHAVTGVASSLVSHFTHLVAWIQHAAARIANGDCGAVSEAMEKIQQVFEGLAAPVIDKIKHLATRVKNFFSGIWDRFGAPVWHFLERIGGQAWNKIKQFARWIWDKAAPIRRTVGRAWTWLKNKLGIGEGPEGHDGILQWVKRKAQSVWDNHIKPFYERFRRPILVVAGVLVMLSPAGPVIAIGAAIGGMAAGIRWIRHNLRNRAAIVRQRGIFQGVIIPAILGAVNHASAFLMNKAHFITGKLTAVVTGLNHAVGAVAGSILGFATRILQWIVDRFHALVNWAIHGLLRLATLATGALHRLSGYLQPILHVLREIAHVVADVMRLPLLLAGRLWHIIPACIRNPFINFFIPLILRQIAFFRELAATPEAWQKTRAQVMRLIHQVFHNFDLMGAIRTAFRIVVRALNIPVQLISQLLDKAANAWDAVIAAPLRFIENSFKAMLQGMGLFMSHILSHLWFGVQGWLLNAVSRSGVAPPSSWSPKGIFLFILDVMGISVDHVIDLIDRRIPGAGRTLRRATRFMTGAMEWLKIALTEGPRGLWNHLVASLGNLGTMVLESAVGWIMRRVVAIVGARIAALAASSGLSGILEAIKAIYSAIQTAIEYMPRILGILIRVFDTVTQIAHGVIAPAARMVESGLHMAMPVVIGFLANYAGLGGIGERIREIIGNVRERVDNAILGLIDRAISAIRRIYDSVRRGVQAGVQAVVSWWRLRRTAQLGRRRATLAFSGNEHNARLTIATSPAVPLTDFLANDPVVRALPPDHAALRQIRAHAADIHAIKNGPSKGGTIEDGREIARLFGLIAELLPDLGGVTRPPPSVIDWSGEKQVGPYNTAWQMIANPLSIDSGGKVGSEPTQVTPFWRAVNVRTGAYIRGHLLNHHLFGPGSSNNLVPITRDANAQMSSRVEENVKRAVLQENKVLSYRVTMVFGSRAPRRYVPAETYLPTQIVMVSWELSPGPGTGEAAWTNPVRRPFPSGTATLQHPLPADTPVGAVRPTVNLSSDGVPAMMRSFAMNPAYDPFRNRLGVMAMQIVSARMSRPTAFASYSQLATLPGFANFVEVLRTDHFIVLR